MVLSCCCSTARDGTAGRLSNLDQVRGSITRAASCWRPAGCQQATGGGHMARWKALPEGLDPAVVQLVVQLRQLKDETGSRLERLAVRTGYSASSRERYLRGRLLPPREALEALAKAAGADPVRLLALHQAAAEAWQSGTPEQRQQQPEPQPQSVPGPQPVLDDAPAAEPAPGPEPRALPEPDPPSARPVPPAVDPSSRAIDSVNRPGLFHVT